MRVLAFASLLSAASAVRLRRRDGGPNGLLTPTPAQLRWQRDEIMGLTHFNMGTFFHNGDPCCDQQNWLGCDAQGGCNASDPASFAPSNLNISNWIESYKALGVTEAVLTAKHGCGYYIWPTNVTLPDGTRYPYAVNESLNVLRQFSDAMIANGLGHGFYYSLTNNFYLNERGFVVQPPSTLLPRQANVTQEQFEAIAIASITELWTQFGDLREIWLDGGTQQSLQVPLAKLLAKLQPNALSLNGEAISPSPGRWSGTEGNVPPGWPNVYSTTCCNLSAPDPAHTCEGRGCPPDDPSGLAFYNPSSTDFTLQAGDVWFWEPNTPLRPLAEMQMTYHATCGANTVMELDFAIDRTGNVAPNHAALYEAFGNWRRSCYGSPLATAILEPGATSVTLPLDVSAPMDRVVLQEAIEVGVYGQCVANYSLEVQRVPGGPWEPFGVSGAHLIGNKRIELNGATPGALGPSINATAVRFNVSQEWCASHVNVSVFSPVNCVSPPPPQSRVLLQYADGRCLVTNTSFPCAGGGGFSCPLFLGDCAAPTALWNDGDGQTLSNLGVAQPNVVNADCNSCSAGTLMKVITGTGSAALLKFDAGRLEYSCGSSGGFCLNGGQGAHDAPCNPSEPFLPSQIVATTCGDPNASGWKRVVVA